MLVFRQDLDDPHQAKFGHIELACQPRRLHLRAADPLKGHVRRQSLEPAHQRAPQRVTRRLSGDDENPHGSRIHKYRPAASRMRTKSA